VHHRAGEYLAVARQSARSNPARRRGPAVLSRQLRARQKSPRPRLCAPEALRRIGRLEEALAAVQETYNNHIELGRAAASPSMRRLSWAALPCAT